MCNESTCTWCLSKLDSPKYSLNYFFKMQNTSDNHHVFLVTVRLLIFKVRPMWGLRFPLPGYSWLSWVSLPGTDHGLPKVPMLRPVQQPGLLAPVPLSGIHSPCNGCHYWLVKQGFSYSAFILGSLQTEGTAHSTLRELPQSIRPNTTSANWELVGINLE